MQTKLITLTAGLVAALSVLGVNAAGAHRSLGGCPELRAACQPIGSSPAAPRPRSGAVGPKIVPQGITDSHGLSVWRAGNHVMQ